MEFVGKELERNQELLDIIYFMEANHYDDGSHLRNEGDKAAFEIMLNVILYTARDYKKVKTKEELSKYIADLWSFAALAGINGIDIVDFDLFRNMVHDQRGYHLYKLVPYENRMEYLIVITESFIAQEMAVELAAKVLGIME